MLPLSSSASREEEKACGQKSIPRPVVLSIFVANWILDSRLCQIARSLEWLAPGRTHVRERPGTDRAMSVATQPAQVRLVCCHAAACSARFDERTMPDRCVCRAQWPQYDYSASPYYQQNASLQQSGAAPGQAPDAPPPPPLPSDDAPVPGVEAPVPPPPPADDSGAQPAQSVVRSIPRCASLLPHAPHDRAGAHVCIITVITAL